MESFTHGIFQMCSHIVDSDKLYNNKITAAAERTICIFFCFSSSTLHTKYDTRQKDNPHIICVVMNTNVTSDCSLSA